MKGFRKKMIALLFPPKHLRILPKEHYATWDFKARQVHYTPLHWLAYWNDSESIHYLIHQIPED
jgi:hypothetical protein